MNKQIYKQARKISRSACYNPLMEIYRLDRDERIEALKIVGSICPLKFDELVKKSIDRKVAAEFRGLGW